MELSERSSVRARRTDPVHRITTAGHAPSADLSGRQLRYLFSMGLRTACFLAAVFTDGWLRWVLLAGAIFLPYISVVIANAGRERIGDDAPMVVYSKRRKELDQGPDRSSD